MRPSSSPPCVAVDQRDQPIADLEADQIDRLDVVPGQLALFGGHGGRRGGRGGGGLAGGAPACSRQYAPTRAHARP